LKNKIAVVGLVCVLVATLMLGCAQKTPSSTPTETVQPSETKAVPSETKKAEELVFIPSWPIKTVDPVKGGYLLLRYGIAETLIGVGEHGELVPRLATSWSVGEDGKTWTITLRKNVKFHDNSKMTAPIVAGYLRVIFNKTSELKLVPVENISAKDDYTLVIKTNTPFASLPAYLAYSRSIILSPNSLDEEKNVVRVIGTGPYKLVSWEPMKDALLERFEGYWGKKAETKRITLKSVPDPRSRVPMLLSGSADVAQLLPPQSIPELEKSPDIKVVKYQITRVRMLQLNCEKEPFSDKRVRLALQYAIDRNAIDEEILNGAGTPAKALFPPLLVWSNKDIEGYTYNPRKAKELLKAAGWKDVDGDGVLENAAGEELIIKFITYPERAELPVIAEAIQHQLKNVGIKAELEIISCSALKEIKEKGDFDIILVGRGLFFVPDPDFNLMQDYHSSRKKTGWGAYGWNNETVDKLLEEARETFDIDKRMELYSKVQKIIYEESPVIVLDYYMNVDAVQKDVKNYKGHINEYCYYLERIYKVSE